MDITALTEQSYPVANHPKSLQVMASVSILTCRAYYCFENIFKTFLEILYQRLQNTLYRTDLV